MTALDLYTDTILQIAGNPPSTPRLVRPDGSATRVSRVCGSRITVDVAVENGMVAAYGAEVSACALGQTSAAIVARAIVGSGIEEMRAVRGAVADMLKRGGDAPGGKWADLACLAAVRDYPPRHGSTLLVFDAVIAALKDAGA